MDLNVQHVKPLPLLQLKHASEFSRHSVLAALLEKIAWFLYEYHDLSYALPCLPPIPLDKNNISIYCILQPQQVPDKVLQNAENVHVMQIMHVLKFEYICKAIFLCTHFAYLAYLYAEQNRALLDTLRLHVSNTNQGRISFVSHSLDWAYKTLGSPGTSIFFQAFRKKFPGTKTCHLFPGFDSKFSRNFVLCRCFQFIPPTVHSFPRGLPFLRSKPRSPLQNKYGFSFTGGMQPVRPASCCQSVKKSQGMRTNFQGT